MFGISAQAVLALISTKAADRARGGWCAGLVENARRACFQAESTRFCAARSHSSGAVRGPGADAAAKQGGVGRRVSGATCLAKAAV